MIYRKYDRSNPDGPKIRAYEELVYSPEEVKAGECPHKLTPWREFKEVGDWVLLDDGGAARVIGTYKWKSKKSGHSLLIKTVCGEACAKGSFTKSIISTGKPFRDGFDSGELIRVEENLISRHVKDFVDYYVKLMRIKGVNNPGAVAAMMSFSGKRYMRYLTRIERNPDKPLSERDHAFHKKAVYTSIAIMKRGDTRWYMERRLREIMEEEQITPAYLLSKLKAVLDDPKSPSGLKVKTSIKLLEIWEGNNRFSQGNAPVPYFMQHEHPNLEKAPELEGRRKALRLDTDGSLWMGFDHASKLRDGTRQATNEKMIPEADLVPSGEILDEFDEKVSQQEIPA